MFSPGQSIGYGSHRRSKSSASTATVTTNTEFRFSQRSNSTATQATSIYDGSGNASTKIPRKLLRTRGRSPAPVCVGGSESDASPIKRSSSRAASQEPAEPRNRGMEENFVDPDATFSLPIDYSESDLNLRLELARKNSLQSADSDRRPARRHPLPHPPVEPIYESMLAVLSSTSH